MSNIQKSYGEFWDFSYTSFYAKGQRFRRPQDALTPSLKEFLTWPTVPQPPARALDAGCGDGLNAVFMATLGYKVTGIDASAVAIRRAAEHARDTGVPVELVINDVRNMSHFPDGAFSLALDNKTYHSLWTNADRERYLHELHRVLAPRAVLFFRQNCAPAELRDEFGWTEFLGKPFGCDLTPSSSDVPPPGPGIWPNSLPRYQQCLSEAGFSVEKALFYKADPEPVSVIWCVRT